MLGPVDRGVLLLFSLDGVGSAKIDWSLTCPAAATPRTADMFHLFALIRSINKSIASPSTSTGAYTSPDPSGPLSTPPLVPS